MSLTPVQPHFHGAYLDADGRPGPVLQIGDLAFFPKGRRFVTTEPWRVESYRGIYCLFGLEIFEKITGLSDEWSPGQLAALRDIQSPTIKRDFYRIVKEVSESGFRREDVVAITAQLILVEFARYVHHMSDLPKAPSRSALADWQMRRIQDYVNGMIDNCPSVDELARVSEISRRHLTRAFKTTTGRTITEYVTEVRMTKARSLLANTDLALKEIAHRVGFSGPGSFCSAFGKAVGMTPNQFRVLHKK